MSLPENEAIKRIGALASPKVINRVHYPEELFPIPGLEDKPEIKYKIVNIVIIGYTTHPIDLEWLCNCFPIMEIENYSKQTKKMSIPYYGYENKLVSCIFENHSRGIRKITKPLKQILYLDYQYYNKNQHIKISKTNIHITGIRSENAGQVCINSILDMIKSINLLLVWARELPEEIKEIFRDIALSQVSPLEAKAYLSKLESEELTRAEAVLGFLTVNSEKRLEEEPDHFFKFVMESLFGTRTICPKDIDIDKFTVHNKVFYIDMNYNINLRKVNVLANRYGHSVSFFNRSDVQNTEILIKDSQTGEVYTNLKVQKSGGVNFWCGPDSDKSFKAFRIALKFLEKCFTTPCGAKRIHERKTPRGKIE